MQLTSDFEPNGAIPEMHARAKGDVSPPLSWSDGEEGYGGPQPPTGETHHYVFKLFAIDERLELEEGANKEQLLDAMRGHVLDQAELVGCYRR